jgi:small subunit ribosomal protein S6
MAEVQVAGGPRCREYETIYVLRPDVAREAQERVAARLDEVVAKEGGRLTLVETWGRRALAYTVENHRRGVYVYLKYVGGGPVVNEIERNLRMLDEVLKYQTVKLREEIDLAAVEVDPENVKFEAVELPTAEEEAEESRERELGLEEAPERDYGAPHSRARDDDAEEESPEADAAKEEAEE